MNEPNWFTYPPKNEWDITRRSVLYEISRTESHLAKLHSMIGEHDEDHAPDGQKTLKMMEAAREAARISRNVDYLLTDHYERITKPPTTEV